MAGRKATSAQAKAIKIISGLDKRVSRIEAQCTGCPHRKKKRAIGFIETEAIGDVIEQDEDAPEGSEL